MPSSMLVMSDLIVTKWLLQLQTSCPQDRIPNKKEGHGHKRSFLPVPLLFLSHTLPSLSFNHKERGLSPGMGVGLPAPNPVFMRKGEGEWLVKRAGD